MKTIFLLFLGAAAPVLANDTAINSGAFGPAPLGEFKNQESVIRMVSENIDISFGKKESTVACKFVFHSTKPSGDAHQVVGFPDLMADEDANDAGVIRKLRTWVDGEEVEAKKQIGWFSIPRDPLGTPRSGLGQPPAKEGPNGTWEDSVMKAWFYTVDVTFPPDRDVVIERKYVADNGGSVMGNSVFSYTTRTGAVWQGTIGRADISVKLDGWTIDDLAFEDGPHKLPPREQFAWCSPNKMCWTVVSPTELRMTWLDFEPAVHQTRREIVIGTWNTRR
jgi:hypothetical protein